MLERLLGCQGWTKVYESAGRFPTMARVKSVEGWVSKNKYASITLIGLLLAIGGIVSELCAGGFFKVSPVGFGYGATVLMFLVFGTFLGYWFEIHLPVAAWRLRPEILCLRKRFYEAINSGNINDEINKLQQGGELRNLVKRVYVEQYYPMGKWVKTSGEEAIVAVFFFIYYGAYLLSTSRIIGDCELSLASFRFSRSSSANKFIDNAANFFEVLRCHFSPGWILRYVAIFLVAFGIPLGMGWVDSYSFVRYVFFNIGMISAIFVR